MNTALFKKIDKIIRPIELGGEVDYHKLQMSGWEDTDSGCGTTRCVAGWAIHEVTGAQLYDDAYEDHSEAVKELAESLGVPDDFEAIGAALLDLPPDLVSLFYTGEDTASEFVMRAARGDSVDSIREWFRDA